MTSEYTKRLAKLLTHEKGVELLELIYCQKKVPYLTLKSAVQNEVTLKRRLDEMKSLGLIKRKISDLKYKPTIYYITPKGKALFLKLHEIETLLRNE